MHSLRINYDAILSLRNIDNNKIIGQKLNGPLVYGDGSPVLI